jgi:PEP-CTERM motif
MVRRHGLILCFAVGILALFSAPNANADDLFSYQVGSNTYTFVVPSSPVIAPGDFVDSTLTTPGYFSIPDVSYSINGEPQGVESLAFYAMNNEGGFALYVDSMLTLNTFGPQLYTGSEDAPTFLLGDFPLNNGSQDGPLDTLTIETAPGTNATPEPSSLLLLAGGLLSFLGLAWKRRIAAQSIS